MRTLAAFLLLQLASLAALALPSEIQAEYQLVNNGLTIGRVNESFVRTGDDYTIESITRSEGVLKLFLDDQIVLESAGKVDRRGLRPLRFGQRRASDASRDIAATFDWEKGVMVSRADGKEKEIPLPRQTQDRISMMYQFMNLARPKGDVVLTMSNGRKVENYRYRLVDEPMIATPAGEFATMHFTRITDTPKESHAEVWLAKDHFNFPVRVVFDDPKGLRLEQTLVVLKAR